MTEIRWRSLEDHHIIWIGWLEDRPLYLIVRGRKGWHRLYLLQYGTGVSKPPLGSYLERQEAEAAATRHYRSIVA